MRLDRVAERDRTSALLRARRLRRTVNGAAPATEELHDARPGSHVPDRTNRRRHPRRDGGRPLRVSAGLAVVEGRRADRRHELLPASPRRLHDLGLASRCAWTTARSSSSDPATPTRYRPGTTPGWSATSRGTRSSSRALTRSGCRPKSSASGCSRRSSSATSSSSTALLERLGDRAWAELLREHNVRIRAAIDRYRGREIDSAGDGFLALFDGAAKAVHAAALMDPSVAELGAPRARRHPHGRGRDRRRTGARRRRSRGGARRLAWRSRGGARLRHHARSARRIGLVVRVARRARAQRAERRPADLCAAALTLDRIEGCLLVCLKRARSKQTQGCTNW